MALQRMGGASGPKKWWKYGVLKARMDCTVWVWMFSLILLSFLKNKAATNCLIQFCMTQFVIKRYIFSVWFTCLRLRLTSALGNRTCSCVERVWKAWEAPNYMLCSGISHDRPLPGSHRRAEGCRQQKARVSSDTRFHFTSAPMGIRTPVLALKGPRPGPLDDGGGKIMPGGHALHSTTQQKHGSRIFEIWILKFGILQFPPHPLRNLFHQSFFGVDGGVIPHR